MPFTVLALLYGGPAHADTKFFATGSNILIGARCAGRLT